MRSKEEMKVQKNEIKKMTLREMKNNHPEIFNRFENLAKPYCTRLFDLGEENKGIPDFIASGTFVRIGGRPGILTNHHVAMIFGLRKRSFIYVPGYKSEKIHGLRYKIIVSLPHYPADWEIKGVDISFIELESETAIIDLGYDIWDLDKSAQKHFSEKINMRKKGAVHDWIWGFEATPSEKVSQQENTLIFEKSGFHFLGPESSDLFSSIVRTSNGDFSKKVDELYCEINREGVDAVLLPDSYGGTSGSAVWRGAGNLPEESISDFDLTGVQADELQWVGPAVAVIFRGPCSLYDTFYKFCLHYITHEDEIAALQNAGFIKLD